MSINNAGTTNLTHIVIGTIDSPRKPAKIFVGRKWKKMRERIRNVTQTNQETVITIMIQRSILFFFVCFSTHVIATEGFVARAQPSTTFIDENLRKSTSHRAKRAGGGRAPGQDDSVVSSDAWEPTPCAPSEVRLTIIQITDTYTLENLASVKTLVADVKAKSKGAKVISMMTGDFLSPYLLSSVDRGQGMMNALAKIPIDYLTWGNHEVRPQYWGIGRINFHSSQFQIYHRNRLTLITRPYVDTCGIILGLG